MDACFWTPVSSTTISDGIISCREHGAIYVYRYISSKYMCCVCVCIASNSNNDGNEAGCNTYHIEKLKG